MTTTDSLIMRHKSHTANKILSNSLSLESFSNEAEEGDIVERTQDLKIDDVEANHAQKF